MIGKIYNNFILKYSRFFLAIIILSTIYLSYNALSLKIDASSDTLILENDKDLEYFQLLSKRYKTPEFLVVAFTPNTKLFSKESLNTIRNISTELMKLKKVKSINSILNVPLLESSKKSLADILEGVPKLEDKIVDFEDAKNEFLNSPLYKENLVSTDFGTTAMLVNLRENTELSNTRSQLKVFKLKILEKSISQDEYKDFQKLSDKLRILRDKEREEQNRLILETRKILKYQGEKKINFN